ncbi:MAG: LytTR family DNA-binding domain-containing protein [Bacteroidota bacterium]
MLKCLIVEDDYAFAIDTKIKAEEAGVKVSGIVSSFSEIKAALRQEKIDLILSDVKLKNGEYAFDLFNTLPDLPPIILFSGIKDSSFYDRSKESKPYIYLSKPFDDITLKSAIEGALRQKKELLANSGDIQKGDHHLFVRSNGQMINLRPSDILYLQSEGNYIYLYTKTRKIAIRSSIKNVITKIDSPNFIQVHRGYAVNIMEVSEFNISENFTMIHDRKIPIGRKYKKEFKERLKST